MIIKRVEKLIVFPRKIWKSELLKVINSKTLKMLILTCGFIGGKYPRHFLFNFCQWISFLFFLSLKVQKTCSKIPCFVQFLFIQFLCTQISNRNSRYLDK